MKEEKTMEVQIVFEIPLLEMNRMSVYHPSSIYGNPISDMMETLARECEEIFAYSWGEDEEVFIESYLDHEYSPENAVIGLGIMDDHAEKITSLDTLALSNLGEFGGELMAMRKSVETVAKRFDTEVILIII